MSDYLVTLRLVIGEYEKSCRTVVTGAPNEEAAGEFALVLECHGDPSQIEFHDRGLVYDMGGEMAYRVSGTREVTRKLELSVLKKYIGTWTYDADMIEEVVNS